MRYHDFLRLFGLFCHLLGDGDHLGFHGLNVDLLPRGHKLLLRHLSLKLLMMGGILIGSLICRWLRRCIKPRLLLNSGSLLQELLLNLEIVVDLRIDAFVLGCLLFQFLLALDQFHLCQLLRLHR